MSVSIKNLDHFVMTVASIDITCDFYIQNLGMIKEVFGSENRVSLKFGSQKINLHQAGAEFEPKAGLAKPGTEDLCFITETSLSEVQAQLEDNGVTIIEGPVLKTGALGPMMSLYFRDPDMNLIEVSNYKENSIG